MLCADPPRQRDWTGPWHQFCVGYGGGFNTRSEEPVWIFIGTATIESLAAGCRMIRWTCAAVRPGFSCFKVPANASNPDVRQA